MPSKLTSKLCEGTDGINNILKELHHLKSSRKQIQNPELQR